MKDKILDHIFEGLTTVGYTTGTYSAAGSSHALGSEFGEVIAFFPRATTEYPQSFVLGGTTSTILGIGGETSPGGDYGPFWEDSSGGWHLKNTVPFSQMERRAEQVYNALHSEPQKSEAFPTIVAESPEVYEAAVRLLGRDTPGAMDRKLEILESALTYETERKQST